MGSDNRLSRFAEEDIKFFGSHKKNLKEIDYFIHSTVNVLIWDKIHSLSVYLIAHKWKGNVLC